VENSWVSEPNVINSTVDKVFDRIKRRNYLGEKMLRRKIL
jgi:hypothetical protein